MNLWCLFDDPLVASDIHDLLGLDIDVLGIQNQIFGSIDSDILVALNGDTVVLIDIHRDTTLDLDQGWTTDPKLLDLRQEVEISLACLDLF